MMASKHTTIYFHGYGGSPNGNKANALRAHIEQFSDREFIAPSLPLEQPHQCHAQLTALIEAYINNEAPPLLVGSSMGGFWAAVMAEQFGLSSVLINPCFEPTVMLPEQVRLGNMPAELSISADYRRYVFSVPCQPCELLLSAHDELFAQDWPALIKACKQHETCQIRINNQTSHRFEDVAQIIEAIERLQKRKEPVVQIIAS